MSSVLELGNVALPTQTEVDLLTNEELLAEWYALCELKVKVDPIFIAEKMMRDVIVARFFPDKPEGTTNYDLGDKWQLKCTVQYKREILDEVLPAVMAELHARGISTESLIKFEPKLDTRAYKAQNAEVTALLDTAIVTKPQSPQVTIKQSRR